MLAKWFRKSGACQRCGKTSTGDLMSDRNEIIGRFCEGCARQRIHMDAPKGDRPRGPAVTSGARW